MLSPGSNRPRKGRAARGGGQVVPPSGNLQLGSQQIWLGPATVRAAPRTAEGGVTLALGA
jgi:hypothetical protein